MVPGPLPPCPHPRTSLAALTSPRRCSGFRWEPGRACWGLRRGHRSHSLMAGDEERSPGETWEGRRTPIPPKAGEGPGPKGWPGPARSCPTWETWSQTSGWLLCSVTRLNTSARFRAKPSAPGCREPSLPATLLPDFGRPCPQPAEQAQLAASPAGQDRAWGEEQAAGTSPWEHLRGGGDNEPMQGQGCPQESGIPPPPCPPEMKLPRPWQAEERMER